MIEGDKAYVQNSRCVKVHILVPVNSLLKNFQIIKQTFIPSSPLERIYTYIYFVFVLSTINEIFSTNF